MKTHQILNLSFLCAAAVLPVYGSNYDDAYAQPLYNNEDVDLPAWVKEEFADINLQLRNKLSPEDYLEILKGEYFLFSKFATRKQYKKRNRQFEFNTLIDIDKCKDKLQRILDNPDDTKLFARVRIPRQQKDGISYRSHLKYTSHSLSFTHDKGVLTRTEGESGSGATLLTCWDPRTAREIGQIYIPTVTGSDGNTICATHLSNGMTAYLIVSSPSEYNAEDWAQNFDGSFIWIPERSTFQRFDTNISNAASFRTFSKTKKGDIYNELQLREIPESQSAYLDSLPDSWFKVKDAGIPLLGNDFFEKKYDFYFDGAYISCRSIDSKVYFTPTKRRDDQGIAIANPAYCIDLNTLSHSRVPKSDSNENLQSLENFLGKLRQSMIPHPITYCDEGYSNLLGPFENREALERALIRGIGSKGYYPFALIAMCFDQGSDGPDSLIGILTPDNTTYLYDWNLLKEKKPGKLRRYDTCISKSDELDGNIIREVRMMSAPYIRHFSFNMKEDGVHAEVVMIMEWDEGKANTLILNLDTNNFSYTVEHAFETTQRSICPIWMSDRQWFWAPVSDTCYHIKKINDNGSEEKIADFYIDSNQGYAIVLPNGIYAGSPGCEKFLVYGEGDRSVGLEALAPWKNRPAAVLQALEGDEDNIIALRETTKRWLHKLGLSEKNIGPAPSLTSLPLANVELPNLFTKQKDLTFTVQLKASALKALTKVEVYAEGKIIPQAWDNTLLVPAGEQKNVTIEVPLSVGQNWLEIRPVDSMGITGSPVQFRVINEDVTQPSELYVVALGVSDYNDDTLDLKYAAKDAQDIVECFKDTAKGKINTLVLTDKEVADDSVLTRVTDFLGNAKMNDRVVLYVAGHGFLDDKLEYRYAPAAFDINCISETGISMDALVATIKSSPARKGLLLLDTCHSGALGEAGVEMLAANGITMNNVSDDTQLRGMQVKKVVAQFKNERQHKRYIEDMFSMGTTYRGINILAGAAGAEYAHEGEAWSNGVFTASIMQTLRNISSADTNSDAVLSVEELQNRVQELVLQYSQGKQKPTVVSTEDYNMDIITTNIPWLSEVKQRIADYATATEQKATDWEKVRQWSRGEYSTEDATEVLLALAKYDMPTDILFKLLQAGVDADLALKEVAGIGDLNFANMKKAFEFGASKKTATECLSIRFGYDYLTFLQRHGADIRAKGTELLHKCAGRGTRAEIQDNLRCLQLILSEGVDVNAQDEQGNTALHRIMCIPDEDTVPVIDALLLAGANPNIRNNEGKRPQEPGDRNYRYLQQRAEYIRNNPGAVRVPTGSHTEAQTFLNTITNYSPSNETMKLYKKRLTMLLPMIINGADVNVTTTETKGNTALHYAAGMGYYDLVEWLVNNGAEINRKTNRGKTPLDCVGNDPGNRIRNFLKNRGAVKSN